MTVFVLGVTLLVAAIVSLTIYVIALWRLLRLPRRPGLVRTAVCRVFVAVLYVGVGHATVIGYQHLSEVALIVFIIAQLVWQANSALDVRISRQLNAGGKAADELA